MASLLPAFSCPAGLLSVRGRDRNIKYHLTQTQEYKKRKKHTDTATFTQKHTYKATFTQKHTDTATFTQGWKFALWFFEQIAHFLCAKERKSDSLLKKSESLPLLFCKERQSEMLTVAIFLKRRVS